MYFSFNVLYVFKNYICKVGNVELRDKIFFFCVLKG